MTKTFEMMLFRKKELVVKLQRILKELEKPPAESDYLQLSQCEVASSNTIHGVTTTVMMNVNYLLHCIEQTPEKLERMEAFVENKTSNLPEA